LDRDSVSKERKKSDRRRKKDKRKGKSSRNISSSDDDQLDKIKKGSRKKKWYSSDENSSFYTTESESDRDDKKRRRKGKKKRDGRSRSGKKEYTSEDDSASDGSDGSLGRQRKHQKSRTEDGSGENKIKGEATDIARKEMGLDWMLRSESKRPAVSETKEILPEEVLVEEVCRSIKFQFPSAVQMSSSHVNYIYVLFDVFL